MDLKQRAKAGLGIDKQDLRARPFSKRFTLRLLFKNFAYDVQSEGERSWYALRLLSHHPARKRIVKRFAEHLPQMPDDYYWGHKRHAWALGARLWQRGWLPRRVLFDSILHHQKLEGGDLNGLLRLGRKGVRLYLKEMGKYHAAEPFAEYYPYEAGNRKLLRLVERYRIERADISKQGWQFLKDVRHWQPAPRPPRPPRFTDFAAYLAFIQHHPLRGRNHSFFASLTRAEEQTLYQKITHTSDDQLLSGLLAPFTTIPYRGPLKPLLDRYPAVDRLLNRRLMNCLGQQDEDRVYDLAWRAVEAGEVADGMRLLRASLRLGDDARLADVIHRLRDADQLHTCGYAVQAIADRHGAAMIKRTMRGIYLRSRCGVCRRDLLRELWSVGGLEQEELRLARWDASKEVRGLARRR